MDTFCRTTLQMIPVIAGIIHKKLLMLIHIDPEIKQWQGERQKPRRHVQTEGLRNSTMTSVTFYFDVLKLLASRSPSANALAF